MAVYSGHNKSYRTSLKPLLATTVQKPLLERNRKVKEASFYWETEPPNFWSHHRDLVCKLHFVGSEKVKLHMGKGDILAAMSDITAVTLGDIAIASRRHYRSVGEDSIRACKPILIYASFDHCYFYLDWLRWPLCPPFMRRKSEAAPTRAHACVGQFAKHERRNLLCPTKLNHLLFTTGLDRKSTAAHEIPLFGSFACRSAVQPYCATKEIQLGKVNIRENNSGANQNRRKAQSAYYYCTLVNTYLYCYNADRDRRLMEMAIRLDKVPNSYSNRKNFHYYCISERLSSECTGTNKFAEQFKGKILIWDHRTMDVAQTWILMRSTVTLSCGVYHF